MYAWLDRQHTSKGSSSLFLRGNPPLKMPVCAGTSQFLSPRKEKSRLFHKMALAIAFIDTRTTKLIIPEEISYGKVFQLLSPFWHALPPFCHALPPFRHPFATHYHPFATLLAPITTLLPPFRHALPPCWHAVPPFCHPFATSFKIKPFK